MLLNLIVKNFAIIEDISIDFKSGLTVLTGETGAGKSLILDTISLLLGQRADTDMIRYGKTKAEIKGEFDYQNEAIDTLLERFSIPKLETLTIERHILSNSNNAIKMNGCSVTLNMLKQVALLLADIHTQNDTFKLFNPDTYLEMVSPVLDSKYQRYLNQYTISYSKYLHLLKQYEKVLKGQKESEEKIENLKFEEKELSSLNLYIGMDEELKSDISKLENHDKIYSNLTAAYENLQNEYFSIDSIYDAASALKKIADLDAEFAKNEQSLSDCYYILDEIKTQISKTIESMDFSQEELNQKIELYQEIEKVKSKYHKTVPELLSYLEEIKLEIDMICHYDNVLKRSYDELKEAYQMLKGHAEELSEYRKQYAKKLEKGIIHECEELDLKDSKFEVEFKKISLDNPLDATPFKETGIDEVSILISFNEGEPLKALHKVASGGEMSRIMLAFKSFFAASSGFSLMVFDEIDTGVSGATAKKIAIKLSSIAKYCQVLCITHLPQVASMGNSHIHIYKEVSEHRTTTHFKYLNLDERIEEVAMMLSGDKMSLYALEHAKALLEEATMIK